MDLDLEDYPRSVRIDGKRLPLTRETRWTRVFSDPVVRITFRESRFNDGSASTNLSEIKELWPSWSRQEMLDFANSLVPANLENKSEILRFVAESGDHHVCSSIALAVAETLPQHEAVMFLESACEAAPAGKKSNFFQAITHLKPENAAAFIRKEHDMLWRNPNIGEKCESGNWVAIDCINSIKDLITLGADKHPFEEEIHFFLRHSDERAHEYAESIGWPIG